MLNLVLAHVNTFGVYFIENKLDFVSFDDKNLQRRRKFVGERDFPLTFQCPSHSRDPEFVTSLVQSAILRAHFEKSVKIRDSQLCKPEKS